MKNSYEKLIRNALTQYIVNKCKKTVHENSLNKCKRDDGTQCVARFVFTLFYA